VTDDPAMLTFPHFTPHFPRAQWTLAAVLEHHAQRRGDAPFLQWTDTGQVHSFEAVNRLVNRLAHGFLERGVGKGDKVVLFLPNCLEYVFAWFALMKIGAIEVPVGDSGKGAFLEHQMRLAAPRLVITTAELVGRLAEIEPALDGVLACYLVGEPAKAPAFARIEQQPFDRLYHSDDSNPGIALDYREPAAVLYTSGTTGPSKAVVMSHSQFYFFAEETVQMTGLGPDDCYMTGFPLFHGNAQFMTVYPSLIVGARCVLYERFSATDFFGRARRSGATVANLLGATSAFLCAQPPGEDDRAHGLRRIFAAPISPELVPLFAERFGIDTFVNGFGQTEISLPFITPAGHAIPPHSVGVLVDQWFEVRLADPETDEQVADGETGELLVRPRQPFVICSEYLGMPEKTVETWRNLWFHTGDAMRRDKDGWYYFVDRVKDALRRRGENISSFEVESVVRTFPSVAECAVVAVPADEQGGEDEIKACVTAVGGMAVDPAELIAWCDARMPAFMVPRYVEVLDTLPQTPSEKVRKKELRDRGITAATWDRVKAGVHLADERSRATPGTVAQA
jgi:crotonobetaine/carnitine-CoA ligase